MSTEREIKPPCKDYDFDGWEWRYCYACKAFHHNPKITSVKDLEVREAEPELEK